MESVLGFSVDGWQQVVRRIDSTAHFDASLESFHSGDLFRITALPRFLFIVLKQKFDIRRVRFVSMSSFRSFVSFLDV